MNWSIREIQKLCKITRGASPRPIQKWMTEREDGIPWIKISDATSSGGRTIERTAGRILREGEKKSVSVYEGDLILSNSATPGIPKFVGIHACIHDGWLLLREFKDTVPEFLFYLLKHERRNLVAQGNGSVFTNLKTDILKNHQVSVPPLAEQKAIAHILGTLDDKIELNQKMNQTLEEISKAIFKSWFVDFDPVRAKADGRPTGLPPEISDLFPDELVDSEIGEIPKGWETTFLSNQLSFVLGGDWGKADESDATPHECRCVRGADIANLQQFVWSDMPTRYLKESSFQKRSLQDWDIVFEISGGSPTQSTGRSVLITKQLLNAYEASVTTSNFCRLLRFGDPQSALFHYQKFRSSYDRDEFFMYETGTTGIKNFGFKYYSEDIPYTLPPSTLLEEFFEIAQPMIEKAGFNMRENMVLSELRDSLLPKLISGELRIPDAEKFLEEAGI